jgi:hypothetical protein
MKIRTRAALGLASLGLLAATAALAAPVAGAGVVNAPKYTNATSNAVSGYFASAGGTTFTHIEGYSGSNGTNSLENIGTAASNGVGVGLCNQTSGDALQAGIVYNGSHTKSVDWATGTFGTAQSNNDKCENGLVTLSPIAFSGLDNIAVSDTVAFQILYDGHHSHNGCSAGNVLFLASDVTANPGVWISSGCQWVGTVTYNEADAGVVADSQGMTPPATQYLATFAHLGLSGHASGHSVHGSFQNNSNWSAFPVFSTTNGLSSGGKVLAPQAFSHDHFDELSGVPNT